MPMTEDELRNEASALNAILQNASLDLKGASEAAQLRAREQAAARLAAQKSGDTRALMEARLGISQQEGELNRAAAKERAQIVADFKRQEAMRGPQAVLGQLDQFRADVSSYAEGETGLDTALTYAQEYGSPLVSDLAGKAQSGEKQGLQARATALDNYVRELVTTGVLSNQDVQNLKPLALSGTPTPDQILIRISAIENLVRMKAGIPQPDTSAPLDAGAVPSASAGNKVINFGDLPGAR